MTTSVLGYEASFQPTAVDEIELKVLPAATILQTTADGQYFRNSNNLFRRLFRYIKKNEVAMTVPVVARMEPGTMQFFVGTNDLAKALRDEGDVRIESLPARTVASIGGRGGYSKSNFHEAKRTLEVWLATHQQLAPIGEAYAVYWSGPFVPWFLKRYEVHIPVTTECGSAE